MAVAGVTEEKNTPITSPSVAVISVVPPDDKQASATVSFSLPSSADLNSLKMETSDNKEDTVLLVSWIRI